MTLTVTLETESGTLTSRAATDGDQLRRIAERRFDLSISTATSFFEENAEAISSASLQMAVRFHKGGRLFVFGDGADATDAAHVAVEFVHPVIVGKRALPAIALTNDVASTSAKRFASAEAGPFSAMLGILGRPTDIALAIGDSTGPRITGALEQARTLGMLTLSIDTGAAPRTPNAPADHRFLLPSGDSLVAQEVGETLYHILWELVHLFLEHGCGDAAYEVRAGVASPEVQA